MIFLLMTFNILWIISRDNHYPSHSDNQLYFKLAAWQNPMRPWQYFEIQLPVKSFFVKPYESNKGEIFWIGFPQRVM